MLNGLAEAVLSINMVIDLIGKISLIWEIVFNIQRILKYSKIEHILTNIWASIWYSMSSLISVMWILWALWWCHSPISLLAHIKLTPIYPSVLCCMKKSSPVGVLQVVHKAVLPLFHSLQDTKLPFPTLLLCFHRNAHL